jgi:hypothetical protein
MQVHGLPAEAPKGRPRSFGIALYCYYSSADEFDLFAAALAELVAEVKRAGNGIICLTWFMGREESRLIFDLFQADIQMEHPVLLLYLPGYHGKYPAVREAQFLNTSLRNAAGHGADWLVAVPDIHTADLGIEELLDVASAACDLYNSPLVILKHGRDDGSGSGLVGPCLSAWAVVWEVNNFLPEDIAAHSVSIYKDVYRFYRDMSMELNPDVAYFCISAAFR